MLVVASVIGAGIFFTPGRVAELLPDPRWIFAAWAAGGALSLAGALANAELGAMFPRAGGSYVFLRHAFHPLAGFLVGWLTFFAIYAGTIAALAAAFAAGCQAWLGFDERWTLPFAVSLTVGLSALNLAGVHWGARANNVTSLLKIAALLAFCLLGPLLGEGDPGRVLASGAAVSAPGWVAFGLAMSPVLFSYLGWNASVYVGSEVRDPARNLPRSLFTGLGICSGIYLLVNGVYLYALPIQALQGAPDAGEAAARALFGEIGGGLVALFVLVSVLGTLNATVLVGPRIAYAMALDGLFFRGTDRVTAATHTPGIAIAVQGAVTVGLLLVLRSFPRALDYTTFAILLATIADVLALYRLRIREPGHPRPYRAWGYPVVPGLYLAANTGIALALAWGRPLECLVGLGMLALGVPFYLYFYARQGGAAAGGEDGFS